MSETLYNITVSFKVADELKHTIQYYVSQHTLNSVQVMSSGHSLNEGLKTVTMSWTNVDSRNVAQLQGCIKELAEVFLLKDLKFDEQPIPEPTRPISTVGT